MENKAGEIHVTTDEARGGSTGGNRRWILGVGLLLAIVLVALGFLVPYWTGGSNRMPSQNAQNNMEAGTQSASPQDSGGVVPDSAAQNHQAISSRPDEGAVPAVANSGRGR